MRKLADYLALAKQHSRAKSDRELSRLLEGELTMVCAYRLGRALPSDETMVRLARLAGLNPDVALLELAAWRSSKSPDLAARFYSIAERLANISAVIALMIFLGVPLTDVGTTGKQGSITPETTVYYGKLR